METATLAGYSVFLAFFIGVLKNQNLCTREEMLTLMKGSLFIQIEEDGLEDRDDGVKVEKDHYDALDSSFDGINIIGHKF